MTVTILLGVWPRRGYAVRGGRSMEGTPYRWPGDAE